MPRSRLTLKREATELRSVAIYSPTGEFNESPQIQKNKDKTFISLEMMPDAGCDSFTEAPHMMEVRTDISKVEYRLVAV